MKRRLFSIVLVVIALFFLAEAIMPKAMVTFYPIYKDMASHRMIKNLNDYEIYSTAHFNIYHMGYERNIPEIARQAERSYRFITGDMDYLPKSRVDLLIFPDYESMDSFMGLNGENAEGTYKDGVLGVLSPSITAGLDPGVIPHELTHLVVDDIAKGNYPVWFTEGMALLEEYRINGFLWGQGLPDGENRYTVEQLTNSFNSLDTDMAYKRSLDVVRGISDSKSYRSLLKVLTYLGRGDKLPAALSKIGLEANSLNNF